MKVTQSNSSLIHALLILASTSSTAFAFSSPNIHSNLNSNQSRLRLRSTRLRDSFLDDESIIINANLGNLSSSFSSSSSTSLSSSASSSSSSSSSSFHNDHEDLIDYSRRRVNNRHSANDWLHNIASIPKSTVLKDIRNPLISIACWSAFVSILHKVLSDHTSWSHIAAKMSIGTQMHSLMISSLGLLLVFRTNSAYQRFVEGRKIWEQILGISRNLDRLISLYSDEIGHAKIHRVKHYLASFPYLLRHHIRPRCLGCEHNVPKQYRVKMEELPYDFVETRHEGDTTNGGVINVDDTTDDLLQRPNYCWVDKRNLPWRLLDDKALKRCANAINRPLWACNSIANELVSVPYGPNFTSRERLTMISQVDKLSNAIGQCERIHQTSVPLNYARHALRSLSIWLFTLPFALVKDLGLLTGPICTITAWLMFGVYQIGHSIEDPFQKTLRLSILCNAIRRDILGENKYKRSNGEDEYCDDCDIGGQHVHVPSIPSARELTEIILPFSSQEASTTASVLSMNNTSDDKAIVEPVYSSLE